MSCAASAMPATRIDIVYLWVDGADPAWHARRQQAYAD
ncbi:MAG: Stealth CR1 domain-containing protein [Janthinobacterium lividum]|nr:Stealth CR1 domain-containing protein [Janthinobacterium lividum]